MRHHNIQLLPIAVLFFFSLSCARSDSGFAVYYTLASCRREGNKLTCARRSLSDLGRFFYVTNPATGALGADLRHVKIKVIVQEVSK